MGLSLQQFGKLFTTSRRECADPITSAVCGAGRWETRSRWCGVPVVVTPRQLTSPFDVSAAALDRIVPRVGPPLAPQSRKRFRKDTVLTVDGALAPTRVHTVAEPSKHYRYSTNHQVAIDIDHGQRRRWLRRHGSALPASPRLPADRTRGF